MGIEIVYILGAALLVLALAWGANNYWRRRQGERIVGDRTAEQLFKRRDPDE